jgi:hypothetical protein
VDVILPVPPNRHLSRVLNIAALPSVFTGAWAVYDSHVLAFIPDVAFACETASVSYHDLSVYMGLSLEHVAVNGPARGRMISR